MSQEQTEGVDRAQGKMSGFLTKKRIAAGALALGGMIVGAVVGIAVQAGIESTGMLGPSVESLIAEQGSNFASLQSKLDELGDLSTDPEINRRLTELRDLMARQEALQARANTELANLSGSVADLKQQALSEQGFAAGTADFWLDAGESVTVGNDGNVFAVVRKFNGYVQANMNGERKNMNAGDTFDVESGDRTCTVLLKRIHSAETGGRAGFDVNCA
jgi:hypothetical protein